MVRKELSSHANPERGQGRIEHGTVKASPDSTALSVIHPWLKYARGYAYIPGLAVGISTDTVDFRQGYGITGDTENSLITPETPFRIASLTKLFVAASTMQLVDKGKIDLKDNARRYLPWIPKDPDVYEEFAIDDLLCHLAGIKRNIPGMKIDEGFSEPRRLIDYINNEGIILFEAGKKFKYSNLGFVLLSEIIKTVDGRNWKEYFQQEIANPLGLTQTQTDIDEENKDRVRGFEIYTRPAMLIREDKERRQVTIRPATVYSPAFGAVSTVTDMLQFLSSFLPGDKRILTDVAKSEMLRVYWKNMDTRRALGFNIKNLSGTEVFEHAGSLEGFRTYAGLDFKNRIAVVAFANASNAPVIPISEGIFKTFYNLRNRPEEYIDPIPDSVDLTEYTGLYAGQFFNTQVVAGPNHQLLRVDYDPAYSPYDPSHLIAFLGDGGKDRFTIGHHLYYDAEMVTFHRDRYGKVISFECAEEVSQRGVVTSDV